MGWFSHGGTWSYLVLDNNETTSPQHQRLSSSNSKRFLSCRSHLEYLGFAHHCSIPNELR